MQLFFILGILLLSDIAIASDNHEQRPAQILELTSLENNQVSFDGNNENHFEKKPRTNNYSLSELSFSSNRFSYSSLQMDSVSNCAAVGCVGFCGLGIVATVVTCAVLYQPYRTHVENQTKDTIVLRYQNNCSYKDDKGNTHYRECSKTLYPGDRATIQSSGRLSYLCATDRWGFGRKCTTDRALKECDAFKVTKGHVHYTFTRLCSDNHSSKTMNKTESSIEKMFDLEQRHRAQQYEKVDYYNLRGSDNKKN